MKILLAAAATIIAGLALLPVALADGGTARTAQNDTATALPNRYANTGSASAALQGYTTSGPDGDCPTAQADTSTTAPSSYRNTGSASAALQGYTTIGAGTQLAARASSGNSFEWGDAGIGAAGAIGAALILIGLSLIALRRRGRLAV